MRILFLDLDSLSPDHLGCYGYPRDTSPNIDRIAEQGVRFTGYYTSDAPCAPSRAALMSGRFGIHSGLVGHGGTAADFRREGESRQFRDLLTTESLPGFLRSAGLKTVLFSPFGERHSQWTFYAGFSEIHNSGKSGMESAEEVTPGVLDWIERNSQEDDWFLYVNYWDPHTPYRAPESFGNPFANEPLPDWMTEEMLERHKRKVGPHSAREINMFDNKTNPKWPRQPGELLDMNDLRQMIDGYDCGIRYVDSHVGQLLDALSRNGIMEDLVIIVSADHGENQGQLGIYGEHATADQGTCRIPMIVRWPGVTRPGVDEGLHYHLDFLPTVAELLGKEPSPTWDGRSYAPALTEGTDCGREYLVLSQCVHVCQRSVRFGDWLYMRTYHDGYHLFPKEMLYNLKADPFEQQDVAGEFPDVCMQAVYRLNDWHDEMMATMKHDVDPLWTVIREGGPYHAKGHLPYYVQHLERTGRGDAVPELKKRHPGEFQ
ncbi:sulfatase family protein [Cohnella thailandensis]|uniref:Sulfatase n=1 Tax=Cohnella thailandensis TaxID=557557 RepID=A0A841SU34_9BACL|nr:sulfatase [Cohnella thailandensis]MBB6634519.1 sulfatase [Cohnella thailandensis]MBP1972927.1 arylsulfatase A-like enzyme [Cohnella thailandensis]